MQKRKPKKISQTTKKIGVITAKNLAQRTLMFKNRKWENGSVKNSIQFVSEIPQRIMKIKTRLI